MGKREIESKYLTSTRVVAGHNDGMAAVKAHHKIAICILVILGCLSACKVGPGTTITPTPTPSLDYDTRQQMAINCLDLWLNTEAPPDIIDAGLVKSGGVSAITRDADGLYHANSGTISFAEWVDYPTHYVPLDTIADAILAGWGCPYDPVVKAKIEQAEQECLDIWANNEPPQSAIDAGLATTLPDGTSVQPVITRNASGAYHVDVTADGFQTWADSTDYYAPWDDITSSTLFGHACPYGPSPEQTPTAMPS